MCLQVYSGTWYMVHHAMVHRPMFEPGEMLCMGRAGLGRATWHQGQLQLSFGWRVTWWTLAHWHHTGTLDTGAQ